MANYKKQMLFQPRSTQIKLSTDFPEKSSYKLSGEPKPDHDPDNLSNLPSSMRFDPILAILLLLYKVIFMLASQFSKLYNLLVNNLQLK